MPQFNSILTVISAASDQNLTNLENVKEELNITTTDNDDLLEKYIIRASKMISDYCNRIFLQETVSEMWRVWDLGRPLILKRTPVSSITSVIFGSDTIDSSLYEMNPNSGLVWSLSADGFRDIWPSSSASDLTVTYIGGYELLEDLPPPIEDACIRLVAYRWMSRGQMNTAIGSGGGIVRSTEIPGVLTESYDTSKSVSIETGMNIPQVIKDLLAPYRRLSI